MADELDLVKRLRSESASIAQDTVNALADAVDQMADGLKNTDKKAAIWTKDIAKYLRACEAEGNSKLDSEAADEITRLRAQFFEQEQRIFNIELEYAALNSLSKQESTQLALKDKALEPFAKLLKAYEEDDPLFSHVENHYVIDGIDHEDNREDVVITVGDLRRAAQALSPSVRDAKT